MKRLIFAIFGLLEFTVAGALAVLGCSLPGHEDLAQSFGRAERVTDHAGAQVRLLRQQVHDLRRTELRHLADRLQAQTASVTQAVQSRSVNFDTVESMRDALADVADGLEGLAKTFKPDAVRKIVTGVGTTANTLDKEVVPASEKAMIQRDAKDLKNIAVSLRQAENRIEGAVDRWPNAHATLVKSATVFRTARSQLDRALEHRSDYESALQETIVLADSFASVLPLLIDQLETQLDEQEHGLDGLGQSIEEFQDLIPQYAHTTSRLVLTGRILIWLVTAIAGLHASYLLLTAGLGKHWLI